MCFLVLSLLKVGHEAVNDMRLWGEEVHRIDIAIRRTTLVDLLDICDKESGDALGVNTNGRGRTYVLVMFSFKMVSSSRTLSINRRESASTTNTFHYALSARQQHNLPNQDVRRLAWFGELLTR